MSPLLDHQAWFSSPARHLSMKAPPSHCYSNLTLYELCSCFALGSCFGRRLLMWPSSEVPSNPRVSVQLSCMSVPPHPMHCTANTCGGRKPSFPDQCGFRCLRSLQGTSGLSNLSGLMPTRLQFIALMLQFLVVIFGPTCSSNIFPLTLSSLSGGRKAPASQPFYLLRTFTELSMPSLGV